jgi:hypothetical protein
VIPKPHQKHPILWPQHILQKNFQVVLMFLQEMLLAPARIHNQSQRQRHIHATRKIRDLLRHGIFVNLEVFLRQVIHQPAIRIPNGKRHRHQVYIYPNRFLRPAHRAHETRQCRNHRRHPSAHTSPHSAVANLPTYAHPACFVHSSIANPLTPSPPGYKLPPTTMPAAKHQKGPGNR